MIRGEGLEGERMRRRSEYNQLMAHRDVRQDPGERRKPYFDKDAKNLIVGGSYTRIRAKAVIMCYKCVHRAYGAGVVNSLDCI